MKRFGKYILVVGVVLLAVSCKKSQLKKPTEVSMYIDINRSTNDDESLVFSNGFIIIDEFEMEGTRQEGAPVSMKREFVEGYKIDFTNSLPIDELILDVPQGNYIDLEIGFNTHKVKDVPNIRVEGVYTNASSVSIPVIYEFEAKEKFKIKGKSKDDMPIITLDKDKPADSFIELDPLYWFDTVSPTMWDAATLTDVDGVGTILINEDLNTTIYDVVTARLDEAVTATFAD